MAEIMSETSVPKNSLTVEVETQHEDMIVVKYSSDAKKYYGVLLRCDPSSLQHGVNVDRVRGAPFWPPLSSSSGVNPKTIPCSTERYSYKLEGQPSNLNVFQPEVIKRSNRNQPAPQLSRILRPRRFVCRKCKKAYHVEDNGSELSSSSLALQTEGSTSDSVLIASDTGSVVGTDAQNTCKIVRRGHLISVEDSIESIRQVTPSIFPKLTEDYALSGRESEAESNPEDITTGKRRKPVVEQSEGVVTPLMTSSADATTRKVNPEHISELPVKRLKRIVRTLTKSKPDVSSDQILNEPASSSDGDSLPSLKNPTKTANPPSKSVDVEMKQECVQLPKNRIKAQYVSVATPFRFPPSRSSKPNMFSITQLTSPSRDKSAFTRKRPLHAEHKQPANLDTKLLNSTLEPAKCSMELSTKKTRSKSARSQARDCVISDTMESSHRVDFETPQHSVLPLPSSEPLQEVDIAPAEYNSLVTTSVQPCPSSVIDEVSQSETKQFSSSTGSPERSSLSADATSKARATDFEKPKNRWIREAKARRTPDERTSSMLLSQEADGHQIRSEPSASAELSAVASNTSPSSTNKFRTRSRESASTTNRNQDSAPAKTTQSSKKRTSSRPSSMAHNDLVPPPAQLAAPTDNCVDSNGAILPVLKIKINRTREPSNTSAQYELVGLVTRSGEENDKETGALPPSLKEGTATHPNLTVPSCDPSVSECSPFSSTMSVSSNKEPQSLDSVSLGRSVDQCELPDGVVFRVGDLVWSKLSGWPSWPAQIRSIHQLTTVVADSESGKPVPDELEDTQISNFANPKRPSYSACLHWFAWHQVSYMPCDKLFHFLQHYKRFDNKKKRGIFRQAVKEALQKSNEQRLGLNPELATGADVKLLAQQEADVAASDVALESSKLVYEFTTEDTVTNDSVGVTHDSLEHSSILSPVTSSSSIPVVGRTNRVSRGTKDKGKPCDTVASCSEPVASLNSLTVSASVLPSSFPGPKRRCGKGKAVQQGSKKPVPPTPLVDSEGLTNPESSGTLRLVLSTARLKLPNSKQKNAPRKRKAVKIKNGKNLDDERRRCQVGVPGPNSEPSSAECNPIATHFVSAPPADHVLSQDAYGDPSNELLSQFPHVFPDLRASGILSDSVDIPTFSEDESEEEDAGRLIIDPDVMASVNSVSPLSNSTSLIQSNFTVPQSGVRRGGFADESCYSQASTGPANTSANRAAYTSVLFSNPSQNTYSTACGTIPNLGHSLTKLSNLPTPSSAFPFTPDGPPVSHAQFGLPLPQSGSQSPHLEQDTSLLSSHLAYFRSSHPALPVTTTTTTVPYLTPQYHTL